MTVNPNDPFLKRVLKARSKQEAHWILGKIVGEEAVKFSVALRESLIKQFGINAAYKGKRAVDKIWDWFQPPMDFSSQPSVMQGSTVTMSVAGIKEGNGHAEIQKKAGGDRGRAVRCGSANTKRRVPLRRGRRS